MPSAKGGPCRGEIPLTAILNFHDLGLPTLNNV